MLEHKGRIKNVFSLPYLMELTDYPGKKVLEDMVREEAQKWAREANAKYGYDIDLTSYRLEKVKKVNDPHDRPWLDCVAVWRCFRTNEELEALQLFGDKFQEALFVENTEGKRVLTH